MKINKRKLIEGIIEHVLLVGVMVLAFSVDHRMGLALFLYEVHCEFKNKCGGFVTKEEHIQSTKKLLWTSIMSVVEELKKEDDNNAS